MLNTKSLECLSLLEGLIFGLKHHSNKFIIINSTIYPLLLNEFLSNLVRVWIFIKGDADRFLILLDCNVNEHKRFLLRLAALILTMRFIFLVYFRDRFVSHFLWSSTLSRKGTGCNRWYLFTLWLLMLYLFRSHGGHSYLWRSVPCHHLLWFTCAQLFHRGRWRYNLSHWCCLLSTLRS